MFRLEIYCRLLSNSGFLFVLVGEHDIAWHVPIGTSIKITFTPSAKINMMLEARGLDVG